MGKTFVIKVLSGHNATWQGTVTNVDSQKEQDYRSALELIKLIDSGLSEQKEGK